MIILKNYNVVIKIFSLLVNLFLISGCNSITLMNPKGLVGIEQRALIVTSIILMLLIVIPVIIMTILFSVRYRSSNNRKIYKPDWYDSNRIELVIWLIPLLIIISLSTITWKSTHSLDPKKPIIYGYNKPITIQVISTDWKWIFVYPEYNIASINEVVFPVNFPIKFEITSNSVMNSFFIPQLGSQIYAMSGMNSILYLIANEAGNYKGISSNFSGKGFSNMKFNAIATLNKEIFENWIKKVKISPYKLDTISSYEEIASPSEFNSVKYFSSVKKNIFYFVINKFK